ncbi:formate dehydrogenase subunit alpha [Halieaceae bacterium IMCC8485]|jgi:formate dehydrogenase major subunit|uniref:Formate dehydrogenase subunit alpha n=1 Tax=Candidatus Seongchinamella marina TaxID=2518990 RepID=A0ABT3SS77_9GAMM|nr:formate dehydrogenase subunit alpha [Candidatus Seongchinamella marina]MCX2972836.1 formate dehydrogenase subunit alpha [Candidatus Seongchinamella marina]
MLQYYEPEKDYGTPPVQSSEMVSANIDGVSIEVPAGTSIMRAAALVGIKVPKLCATDSIDAFGSCRICLVEIEGRRGYPASCTTPVEEGMQVQTQTPKLAKIRNGVMELYISDHPLDCLTCPTNGDCELQDTAGEVGLREVRYGFEGENHLAAEKDESNPYFTFDPSKCIVCSRCVRACEETQGTFALTIEGRGFDSKVSAGGVDFLNSECVSCGACVDACPTATLTENSIIEQGKPEHTVLTTCAYCGVGCGFRAELKGEQVVRMTPWKEGKANEGHACVKGRFAFGYATHPDRITSPMIRDSIDEPWRKVSWDEAVNFAAQRFRKIQQEYGRNSIGAISSSRCTNEEVYLIQKLVRAGFGNNNVDTCARVCHSPTGFGLKTTLGESAGTQTFASVAKTDVAIVMGANPTEAHPVFASRLKRRLREGAKLIVIDPRKIELVSSPHIRADYHLPVNPGANVALLNALAHVIVTENLHDAEFIGQRCESEAFSEWQAFIADDSQSPESLEQATGVDPQTLREAARLYASAPNGAIYYGLGVTEHSQGSTAVMGIANLAMLTGNLGREGVGVNPMRGQNNVQGSCDMGSFPHELPGYRHLSDAATRALFEAEWQVDLDPEPGMRIPNMFDAAVDGQFRGLYCQGEDVAQSDPNTHHIEAALGALDCLVVQDIFLNETAKFAHVFLPGASFLEKDGTFINAERRISSVRKVMSPLSGKADWEATVAFANALGCDMNYQHPSEIMDEIAKLTPTFHGVSYSLLDELGSIQWPCNELAPEGTPTMHVDEFVRGKGYFAVTEFVPTEERANKRFPLLLTTGRILSQYNVGAQTRRTENSTWHEEDLLEIHSHDAQERGINEGDWVGIQSRVGTTVLHAHISDRVKPGVIYTTFHHPVSGANVVTTDNSDWATNCPEYKVTAVQVSKVNEPSAWQARQQKFDRRQHQLLKQATEDA